MVIFFLIEALGDGAYYLREFSRIILVGEVNSVTVATQVKTCLASLKSAQANLETFALNTQNQEAKTMFENAAKSTQEIVNQVSSRVQQIENEEPQYKGF
jgi:hypothetical protein